MSLARRAWALRPYAYSALDRPGLRWALSAAATFAARREAGDDVAVVYRGAWFGQVGGIVVAATGSTKFVFRHGRDIRGAYAWQLDDVRDIWLYRYDPRPGDTVVDVGAGVGSETYVFARAVGAQGRVLAVEPHPATFRILESQVAANGLDNVTLERCALTAKPTEVYIEDQERHERNNTSETWSEGRRREPIPGLPLDELRRRHGLERIDFLKMNIEGAEAAALGGMSETIAVTRRVSVACHDFLADGGESDEFRTRARVTEFLRDHGFTVEARADDSRPFVRDHVHAHRPE